MARKSTAKVEEPSSDEASAHSDVEMQDQAADDKMNGFKKFGVSATHPRAFLSRRNTQTSSGKQARPLRKQELIYQSQYNVDTPDYTVRTSVYPHCAPTN